MSTSVYTGLNTFNFYSQKLPADLLVRCFLCTQLLQFLIHYACVDDHGTLQPSAQRLSELPVLLFLINLLKPTGYVMHQQV